MTTPETPFTTEELSIIAIAAGMEKKAVRPVLLDLRPVEAFVDFFAILSASNTRQVAAVTEAIRVFMKKELGLQPIAVDGIESSTWILLDYGAFFVHVFLDTTREIYKLEQLWSKGRFVELCEEAANELLAKARTQISSVDETPASPIE